MYHLYFSFFFRALAELEYLEVDQYIWGILGDRTTSNSKEIILEVSPDQIMASIAVDRCEQQQNSLFLLFILPHCHSILTFDIFRFLFWKYMKVLSFFMMT